MLRQQMWNYQKNIKDELSQFCKVKVVLSESLFFVYQSKD